MKNNKTRIILSITVLALLAILTIFGKEVIEEKDIRIAEMQKEITEYKSSVKELSMMLEQKSENKDIEIVKERNADGSTKEIKRIKTAKNSVKIDAKSNSQEISEKTDKTKISEKTDKTKTHTNPKRLRLSLGASSRMSLKELSLKDLNPEPTVKMGYDIMKSIELETRFQKDSAEVGVYFFLDF